LADLTFRSDWALELAGSAALAGAGVIGDSIGMVDTPFMAAADITPEAERSITATATTEAEASAA